VLRQSNLSFGGPAESAYPSIPNPSPAELMAKRIIDSLPPSKGAGRMPPSPRAKPPKDDGIRQIINRPVKEWIRATILAWPGPTIGWEEVRNVVRKKYPNGDWKRQSLARHRRIQEAFNDTKVRLIRERDEAKSRAGQATKPKAGSDEFLQNRIEFLEESVRKTEAENDRLKQQFVRWQRNAFAAGMTMQQLDRPALRIDRGQADE
jgi:hypothetical protein